MKKLLILGSTFAMGLCAVGIAVGAGQAREAKADEADSSAVATLIRGYMNEGKQYTKKSQIFLTKEEKINQADLFHAKHNVLERTTYYDETANALLMGDFDGGFANIKSGYAKSGDDMVHYFYTGDGNKTADLFTARNEDYTVKNTNPNEYFVTLTDLADLAATIKWTTNGTSYYHNFGEECKTEEDAQVLKAFQYFAAPMLLENTRYNPKYIRVTQASEFLSIRIYDTASDLGYVTLKGDDEALLAEARVYPYLSFAPGKVAYLKGTFGNWDDNPVAMSYYPSFDQVEQYHVSQLIDDEGQFGILFDKGWYAYGDLENPNFFRNESGNICKGGAEQQLDIYFKPLEASGKKIYINREMKSLTIDLKNVSWWTDANARTFIHGFDSKGDYTVWPGVQAAGTAENLVYQISVPETMAKVIVVRVAESTSEAYNQSVDIELNDGLNIRFTGDGKDGSGKLNQVVVE